MAGGRWPPRGRPRSGSPALRSREMAKAFLDREHTDARKMQRKSILGMEGPIVPILSGVQGLTCSPPSCHSHFPHPFPWDCGPDGVPAHIARLLDDEILTLMQALENASLSVASPTAASTAGHVSRASADGMPAYSNSMWPPDRPGAAARTLWRDCTSRRDLRLSKGSSLYNAHGEDRLLGSSIWFI